MSSGSLLVASGHENSEKSEPKARTTRRYHCGSQGQSVCGCIYRVSDLLSPLVWNINGFRCPALTMAPATPLGISSWIESATRL